MLDLVIVVTDDSLGDTAEIVLSSPSSVLETLHGSNFSITCKLVNASDDGQVVWSRFRDKTVIVQDRLDFRPVTFKHRGVYSCISLSHDLSRSVCLIVRLRHDDGNPHKRFKRLNILHFGGRKNKFDPDNQNSTSTLLSSSTRGWIYSGVVFGSLVLIITCAFLFYRAVKHFDPSNTESSQEPRPACNHPNCGQYCTFVESDTATVTTASTSVSPVRNVQRPVSSIATISNKNMERIRAVSTDLPPTYVNTVMNSFYNERYKLPPPYDEALKANRQKSA